MTLPKDLEKFYKELEEKEATLKVIRERMVDIALDLVGAKAIRYRSSKLGMSANGYDCSGFISAVVTQAAEEQDVSIAIPRHANVQWRTFGEPADYRQRKAGDIVYFPSRRKSRLIIVGHVGLVLSKDEYIHSPGKDDTHVMVEPLPLEQEDLPDVTEEDIHTRTPIGIKRVSLPIGIGRWHVH